MSGFTKEELMHYKSVLHSNVLVGIATLIEMAEKMGFAIDPSLQVFPPSPHLPSSHLSSPLFLLFSAPLLVRLKMLVVDPPKFFEVFCHIS